MNICTRTVNDKIITRVLNKAGKSTGKFEHWFNIKCRTPEELNGAEISVDITKLNNVKVTSENNIFDVTHEPDILLTQDVNMESAKLEEIENWRKNNVFEEVTDVG